MTDAPARVEPVVDEVIRGYDLGRVHGARALDGGMFSRPCLLETEAGRFVLRSHTFRGHENAFQFQAEIQNDLARNGGLAPRVLTDRLGRLGRRLAGAVWA